MTRGGTEVSGSIEAIREYEFLVWRPAAPPFEALNRETAAKNFRTGPDDRSATDMPPEVSDPACVLRTGSVAVISRGAPGPQTS